MTVLFVCLTRVFVRRHPPGALLLPCMWRLVEMRRIAAERAAFLRQPAKHTHLTHTHTHITTADNISAQGVYINQVQTQPRVNKSHDIYTSERCSSMCTLLIEMGSW